MKVAEGGRGVGGGRGTEGEGASMVLMQVVAAGGGLLLVFLRARARFRSRRSATVSSAGALPKKSAILGWDVEEGVAAAGRRRFLRGGQVGSLRRVHWRRRAEWVAKSERVAGWVHVGEGVVARAWSGAAPVRSTSDSGLSTGGQRRVGTSLVRLPQGRETSYSCRRVPVSR